MLKNYNNNKILFKMLIKEKDLLHHQYKKVK